VKKLEVHVFPSKTSAPKNFRISLTKVIVMAVVLLGAVFGFILFSPQQIVDNLSDGNVLSVYRQNMVIKKEIKGIRQSVDESILKAEETKLLRDSTISLSGLGFTLEDAPTDSSVARERKSLDELEKSFRRLLTRLEQDSASAAAIPVLHPFKNSHAVKNRFEMIYDHFTEQELPHRGIDYVAAVGDTVVATGAGVVAEVRSHRGFGLSMKIEHLPGIKTFYAHLGQALVQPGTRVKRGQPIALIGESGTESSVALHYEIRLDGNPINPEDYFITKY
jgi:murein DD-endopeptidase MepM/ murein hydrolase activator NlpD